MTGSGLSVLVMREVGAEAAGANNRVTGVAVHDEPPSVQVRKSEDCETEL